jgi:hypothetical protein
MYMEVQKKINYFSRLADFSSWQCSFPNITSHSSICGHKTSIKIETSNALIWFDFIYFFSFSELKILKEIILKHKCNQSNIKTALTKSQEMVSSMSKHRWNGVCIWSEIKIVTSLEASQICLKHDNHVTLLATIYSCANTTHILIFTTCFGRDAPSSGEAEYNTSNCKSLLNCNTNYNKT